MLVDIENVRKYDVPGPRYTSYPPAVHFREPLTAEAVLGSLASEKRRGVSLYFHLPFCRSLCWYCGCNTVITRKQSVSAQYLEYLRKEIALVAPHVDGERRVVQMHLGGGTPTFLLPDELRALGSMVRESFQLARDIEASVEIDPRRLTQDHVAALREAGMNRASIGVQDFDPEVQKAVNRLQSFEQTQRVASWLRSAGFRSLSFDLIYGLPLQTLESFERTLEQVLTLSPDRLAVFSYAHVPWMKPAQRILERSALPGPATKLAILKLTIEKLTSAGYSYIGMDHFARAGDELVQAQREGRLQRNFQGYSTCAGTDILGLGVSSISQTRDLYWQNKKDVDQYYASLDAGRLPVATGYRLTDEDQVRRRVIMRLMCDMRLDFAELSREFGFDFASRFERELDSLHDLETDGLLVRTDRGVAMTEPGRLLVRNAAMRFDAHLGTDTKPTYSRTI